MSYNLAARSREERDRVYVDLAASGVAWQERMNLPVIPGEEERQQPEEMRGYFRKRLAFYRNQALKLSRGTAPTYQKATE